MKYSATAVLALVSIPIAAYSAISQDSSPATESPATELPASSIGMPVAIPEIETGGFFIYQPPFTTLQDAASEGGETERLAWWQDDDNDFDWQLCGFALSKHPTGKNDDYEMELWLATSDMPGVDIAEYRRPGIAGVDNNSVATFFGGPLLYMCQHDGNNGSNPVTKQFSKFAKFRDHIQNTVGSSVTIKQQTTSDFDYYKVTETLQ